MIEQAQFNCYPMGKAFEKETKKFEDQGEKQTKINEDQRKNQIKAIRNWGQVKIIKKYIHDDKNSLLISKQKDIFNKLAHERLDEIAGLDKKR